MQHYQDQLTNYLNMQSALNISEATEQMLNEHSTAPKF